MKTPKPRVHLIDIAEPLLAFRQLSVRCGLTLQNAAPQFMLTKEANFDAKYALFRGICRECVDAEPTPEAKRSYIYGLVEAQELKDSETGETA